MATSIDDNAADGIIGKYKVGVFKNDYTSIVVLNRFDISSVYFKGTIEAALIFFYLPCFISAIPSGIGKFAFSKYSSNFLIVSS